MYPISNIHFSNCNRSIQSQNENTNTSQLENESRVSSTNTNWNATGVTARFIGPLQPVKTRGRSDESNSLRKTQSMNGTTPYRQWPSFGSATTTNRLQRLPQLTNSRSQAITKASNPVSSRTLGLSSESVEPRILSLDEINNPSNSVRRSTGGKTSGVFLLTDHSIGKIKAALKPTNDKEILANRLFETVGMPIARFDVWEVNQIRDGVLQKIDENTTTQVAGNNYKKIMAMEMIMGKKLSECNATELKSFLTDSDNQHLLGRSMALDLMIGNADRIVYFSAPVVNPDNIMVRKNQAVFIDQVFKAIHYDRWEAFYEKLVTSAASPIEDDNCLYNKYVLPLVKKSLKKYADNISLNDAGLIGDDLFKEFTNSITHDDKLAITQGLKTGVERAKKDLIDKKDEIMKLLDGEGDIKKYIDLVYTKLNN